jgi:hypothetical protein
MTSGEFSSIVGAQPEEIPERCRGCLVLKLCAAEYARLEKQYNSEVLPRSARTPLQRMVFSRMGNMCPDGAKEDGSCGSLVKTKFFAAEG